MRLGKTQKFASPGEALAHISETPWSDYSKSDYTLEQWHSACLVHTHDGDPTSKSECKLPVKTPDGALNRNGVHSAAAALGGARGGLKGVSDDQKKTAAKALKRYYAQLDEDPPESLNHHGVKGMHWGVRKQDETGGGGSSEKPVTAGPNLSATGRVLTSSAKAKEVAASNASLKRMMAASDELDRESKPSEEKLMSAKQDWLNKFAPDGPTPGQARAQPLRVSKERKKLTPAQKKLLESAAIGVGVGVGVYLLNKEAKKALGYTPTVNDALKGNRRGLNIPHDEFNTLVSHSQFKTWSTGNFIKPESWAREGYTLDVGHEFRRLSQVAESDFTKPTYSVHTTEDWHRYLTNFRHEKGGVDFHEVKWKLTEPVKVPALKDVIGTMQEVLKDEGKAGTEKEAISAYKSISGRSWQDARSESLVKALKKKGYGALIDEMDAGVIGDKPVVFFSPESATKKTSSPLSMNAIIDAEARVKELQSRKS